VEKSGNQFDALDVQSIRGRIDAPDDLHPLILILGHPALIIELVRGVVSGLEDKSFALLDDDARNTLLRSLLLLGLRIRRLIGLLVIRGWRRIG
jgi:hypothetical protein